MVAVAAFLIYIIIGLTSLAIFYIKKRFNYWKKQGIPYNEPSLITGNFQGLRTKRSIGDCILETYEQFRGTGPFCGFYFFQRPAVLVLDKALVKNVLIKDFSNFTDRGMFYNEKDDPLTGHLFLLDSTKWRNLRNKLSPTFTSGKMKFMYPTIVGVAENFVNVFATMSQQDNTVEMKELLARFTTDVIGTCAFGIDCNSLKDPNAKFHVMGKRSLNERRHGVLLSAFMQGFPDLARKLHMSMTPDDVTNFFLRIVKETVDHREQNNIKRNDFLSLLIDLKKGSAEEKGVKLSIEEIAAQVFVFFLGGFESSSSTMGFALYELAQHQDIQQKMRDEINKAFDADSKINYEALHQMTYVGQVISETLRKYTVVPLLTRKALNDYVVPGNPKYVIKKGMPVLIPAYAMHHDPELYPEPEKFDPERFVSSAVQQRDTVEWLPFGDGPRNCIGLRFGLMQIRVGLAFLVRNFKFSTCDKTEIPLLWSKTTFLLSSKSGIYLKVERI